jgi:hypothetical protein
VSEQSSFPQTSIFVVRFWREGSPSGARWRGRIEHVQSGESLSFLDLESVLQFLGRFGIVAGDTSRGSDCPSRENNQVGGAH